MPLARARWVGVPLASMVTILRWLVSATDRQVAAGFPPHPGGLAIRASIGVTGGGISAISMRSAINADS